MSTNTKSKKPSFSPKHLKLLSFIKWFHSHSHNLPHISDIPNTLLFLNLFLDHSDTHLHALKSHSKRLSSLFNLAKKRTNLLNLPTPHDLPHALHTLHQYNTKEIEKLKLTEEEMKEFNLINTTEDKIETKKEGNIIETEEKKDLIETEIININNNNYLINLTTNTIYDLKTHEIIGKYKEDKIIN